MLRTYMPIKKACISIHVNDKLSIRVPTCFELRTDICPNFIEYFDKILKK
jgi:hypothetical protein